MLLAKCEHDYQHEVISSVVEKSATLSWTWDYGFFLAPTPQNPSSMPQHFSLSLRQKTVLPSESPKLPEVQRWPHTIYTVCLLLICLKERPDTHSWWMRIETSSSPNNRRAFSVHFYSTTIHQFIHFISLLNEFENVPLSTGTEFIFLQVAAVWCRIKPQQKITMWRFC